MCYVLLLSTSSDEELARYNTELVRFSRELPDSGEVERLRYPHRWYVGSKAECSCTFRHLTSVELGFGEPVDWYPEEADEVAATLALIAIVRGLVAGGHQVDCIDLWPEEPPGPTVVEREVDLSTIANAAFRLFDNHHFVFRGR